MLGLLTENKHQNDKDGDYNPTERKVCFVVCETKWCHACST